MQAQPKDYTINPISIPIPKGKYKFNDYDRKHMDIVMEGVCYNCGEDTHASMNCPYVCRYCHQFHSSFNHCLPFYNYRIDYQEYRFNQTEGWKYNHEKVRVSYEIIPKLDKMFEEIKRKPYPGWLKHQLIERLKIQRDRNIDRIEALEE